MDNKRKPPNQRVKIVESSGITKKTKTDVQDNKNVTEPKDHKSVIESKKSLTVEPKDKKTVTIVTDEKDKKIITDTKEKKTVTIMTDPKDRKLVEVKDKRTVTFVTDVKDKKIVTDTKENKIVIEPKEKTILPILTELKEKIVADMKERVILPAVTEIKEKIPVVEVKEKKDVPAVPEVKDKAVITVPEIKEKKPVIETKEKVPVPEVKEKKSAVKVKEKKPVVEKKEDETSILARTVVDNAVASAIQFVEDAKNPVKNIKWLTHGEFTAEKGRKQIEYFVSTWEFQNRWVYYADFIEKKDLIHSFHYIYCVRWSAPTAVRPMARVSANAYFTIKFNKSKPPEMPVEVSYIFENSELLQRPGKIRFREQWLRDITETKHILLESIPFKVV